MRGMTRRRARPSVRVTRLARFQKRFEQGFNHVRDVYRDLLALALEPLAGVPAGILGFVVVSFVLLPFLGSNFFPDVDAGAMVMHVRAPIGTRIEDTAAPLRSYRTGGGPPDDSADQLDAIFDNIGLPNSSINLVYSNSGVIGPEDGDIYINLTKTHRPTADYVRELRSRLPKLFPGSTFSFLPADIVSQILNFGAPAPIDVQVAGPNHDANEAYAAELLRGLKLIPGLADARLQQSTHYPPVQSLT